MQFNDPDPLAWMGIYGSLFAEWEMRDLRIEEAREMYGLMIVGVWMIVIVVVGLWRAKVAASAKELQTRR